MNRFSEHVCYLQSIYVVLSSKESRFTEQGNGNYEENKRGYSLSLSLVHRIVKEVSYLP